MTVFPMRGAATLVAALLFAAGSLLAQAPADTTARRQQRALDSLAAVVRVLQARLDSLTPRRDTAGGDELAALRAAAAAAGRTPGDSAAAAATGHQPPSTGVNLNRLNPEISVTGDVRAALVSPGPQAANFDPREYEFAFQHELDPYTVAKIFLSVEGEEVSVEEGYVYFPALPGRLRLDLGRFRQTVGELNRWHLHAVSADDYPAVIREFAGEEGLIGTGASLFWPVPVPASLGTFELTAQATLADNEVLYGGGSRPAGTAQLNGFWQLSRSAYVMASAALGYGSNPDAVSPSDPVVTGRLETRLSVVGARFTWRPPREAQRREFTLRGELWSMRREFAGSGPTRRGYYADASWRLSRRFIAGARYDGYEAADPTVTSRAWAVSPMLTFWQSEFVYLRALWQRGKDFTGATSDRFTIRAVFAMGPHKHELF